MRKSVCEVIIIIIINTLQYQRIDGLLTTCVSSQKW